MRIIIFYLFKSLRRISREVLKVVNHIKLSFFLYMYNVEHLNFETNGGIPYLNIAKSSNVKIGLNLRMNNGLKYNAIGFTQRCSIIVNENAHLEIGNNLGMSQTAIVCQKKIIIKNNVKLGGGVKIYDTDFHSLNSAERANFETDMANKNMASVTIGNNVFVGANSIILKGVIIGDNSIIGAASVVSKSIPKNEIWGGNPAKFIRKI